MNLLTLGLIGAGIYLINKTKNQPIPTLSSQSSITGLIYKCNYVEVVDKEKFQKFLKDYAELYVSKIENNLQLVDYRMYIFDLVEKLNKQCYKLLLEKKFSKVETTILAVLEHEAFGALIRAYFKKSFFDSEFQKTKEFQEYDTYVRTQQADLIYNLEFSKLDQNEVDQLEHFFEYNGNKYPKKP